MWAFAISASVSVIGHGSSMYEPNASSQAEGLSLKLRFSRNAVQTSMHLLANMGFN